MHRGVADRSIGSLVRKYVLRNARLKAMALVLAVMLWFSMTYLGESKMVFSVPVSFENLSKTSVLRDADSRDVLITLNGPVSILKNMRSRDIVAPLDLSRAKEGRQVLVIKKTDVSVPAGLKIESIKPDYIVVEIDKIVEKQLRTVVKLNTKWVGIYQIASWQPRYVRVEAPKELLDRSDLIETIPVDGDFTRQQETQNVPLNLRSLEAKRARPGKVTVVLKKIGG